MKRVYLSDAKATKNIKYFSQKFVKKVIEGIQLNGGTIVSVSLTPILIFNTEHLMIIYEDNKYEIEIQAFLDSLDYEGPED